MNDVLIRRLIGALVVLGGVFALASLLPPAKNDAPADGYVAIDLRQTRPAQPPPPEDTGAPRQPQTEPEPDPDPEPAVVQDSPPQAPVEDTPPAQPAPPPAAEDGWWVQVASFAEHDNAQRTLARIRDAGLDGKVQRADVNGALRYRVRVGPYSEREHADQARDRLATQGFPDAAVLSTPQ